MTKYVWRVREVCTYPCKWKVYPTTKYIETNQPRNFFPTFDEAQEEADRRNAKEGDSNDNET
jgi:hypothetical protein